MRPAELLLHPVRLRIVQAFLGDRTLTTNDLRSELDDVAAATLYRHIAVLADNGVLQVIEERKVRGTFERTYRLQPKSASVSAEDAAAMTMQEHRHGFLTFIAAVLANFDHYIDRGDADLEHDLVGYRQAAMHLTDDETRDLVQDLRSVLEPRMALPAAEGRRRRLLATILMPGDTRSVQEGEHELRPRQ